MTTEIKPADVAKDITRRFHETRQDQTFQDLLFFITVTFKRRSVTLRENHFSQRRSNPTPPSNHPFQAHLKPTPFQAFGRLQFNINRYLFGNNFRRARAYHPVTWAFVDAEGSHTHAIDINSEMPHVHALTLVRPDLIKAFRAAMTFAAIEAGMPDGLRSDQWADRCIDEIHLENFDENKGSLDNLVAYCMKGYRNTPEFNVVRTGNARNMKPNREPSLFEFYPN